MLLFYKIRNRDLDSARCISTRCVCLCDVCMCEQCEGVGVGVEMKLVLVFTCLPASAGRGASNGVSDLV